MEYPVYRFYKIYVQRVKGKMFFLQEISFSILPLLTSTGLLRIGRSKNYQPIGVTVDSHIAKRTLKISSYVGKGR